MPSSAAHEACCHGDIELFERVLREDPNSFSLNDEHGVSPLYYASRNGHVVIVWRLLERFPILAKQAIGQCTCGTCVSLIGGGRLAKKPLPSPALKPNERAFHLNIYPTGSMQKTTRSRIPSSSGLPVLNVEEHVYRQLLEQNLIRNLE